MSMPLLPEAKITQLTMYLKWWLVSESLPTICIINFLPVRKLSSPITCYAENRKFAPQESTRWLPRSCCRWTISSWRRWFNWPNSFKYNNYYQNEDQGALNKGAKLSKTKANALIVHNWWVSLWLLGILSLHKIFCCIWY